jgi:hypothetical protein
MPRFAMDFMRLGEQAMNTICPCSVFKGLGKVLHIVISYYVPFYHLGLLILAMQS